VDGHAQALVIQLRNGLQQFGIGFANYRHRIQNSPGLGCKVAQAMLDGDCHCGRLYVRLLRRRRVGPKLPDKFVKDERQAIDGGYQLIDPLLWKLW
jgi:hypothetical protein